MKAYDYCLDEGDLIFQVVRTADKNFFQRQPDGKGGWINNLKGVETFPYRMELVDKADREEPHFVAEGEKDVDRLILGGLVATCNPMGAGKWRDEYTEFLRHGLKWVLLPDNDQPGRDHMQKVARSLSRLSDDIRILDLADHWPDMPEKADVSDWLDRGHTTAELRELAAAAPIWQPPAETNGHRNANGHAGKNGHHSNGTGGGGGDNDTKAAKPKADDRPAIEISTERHLAVAAAVDALRRDPDVYYRGRSLVTVAFETEETLDLPGGGRIREVLGSPKVVELSEANIGCHLTTVATFYRMKAGRGGEAFSEDVHPPDWLIRAVATRGHWSRIRPLLAVAECPYPRDDGSIVEQPGYDRATGVLYVPSMAFPSVPDRPGKAEAEAAAERLLAPVGQFPFVGPGDKAVYLAAILSAVARASVDGPVPGTAINGNVPGVGKGLLVDSVSIMATGRKAPTSSYPEDKEESAKVKVAIALAGKSVHHFDNLDEGSCYGNSALDSALTSTEVDDRILGSSRMTGSLPLRVSWFLTGNNVTPGKDAHRRWLPCNLQTSLERPEERDDLEVKDLLAFVREHRGELVRDALTILKAHALAKRPTGKWAPLGSFEAWDPIIRGAVWWSTGVDCCATRRKAAEDSPERADRMAMLEGWRSLPDGGDEGLTTAEAVKAVEGSPGLYATLEHALSSIPRLKGRDGKVSASALGYYIRAMKGRNVEGLAFMPNGKRHQAVVWRVVEIEAPTSTGPRGGWEHGEDSNPSTRGPERHDNDVNGYSRNGSANGNGGHESSPSSQSSPRTSGATWASGEPIDPDLPF